MRTPSSPLSLRRLSSLAIAAGMAAVAGCGDSTPADEPTEETGGAGGAGNTTSGGAGTGVQAAGSGGSSNPAGSGGSGGGKAGSGGSGGSNGGAGSMGAGGSPGNVMGMCPAQGAAAAMPNLQIINWNGHKGAISFTVDDAYGSALSVVIPAMDKRKILGTFYVICNSVKGSPDAWKKAVAGGHEVANHTMSHAGANGTNMAEIVDCDALITTQLGKPSTSFAYPLSNVGEPFKTYTAQHYLGGRGGSGPPILVKATENKDWTNISSDYTGGEGGGTHAKDYIIKQMQVAVTGDSWYVITTHSILPENYFAGIPQADYEAELDEAIKSGAWVATFSQVASYVRNQQALKAAAPMMTADGMKWTWTPPPSTLEETTLRVVVAGGTLSQGGKPLTCLTEGGYFPVNAKAGELTWTK